MASAAVGEYGSLAQNPPLRWAPPAHQSGPSPGCRHPRLYQATDHMETWKGENKGRRASGRSVCVLLVDTLHLFLSSVLFPVSLLRDMHVLKKPDTWLLIIQKYWLSIHDPHLQCCASYLCSVYILENYKNSKEVSGFAWSFYCCHCLPDGVIIVQVNSMYSVGILNIYYKLHGNPSNNWYNRYFILDYKCLPQG